MEFTVYLSDSTDPNVPHAHIDAMQDGEARSFDAYESGWTEIVDGVWQEVFEPLNTRLDQVCITLAELFEQ